MQPYEEFDIFKDERAMLTEHRSVWLRSKSSTCFLGIQDRRHSTIDPWLTAGLSRRRSRVRAPSSPPFLSITYDCFLGSDFVFFGAP